MAYPCPHCNQPLRRASSDTSWQHGLLGVLLTSAMADFECPRCGLIAEEEFSPEMRQQMKQGSWMLVAVGAAVAMAISAFFVFRVMR
jgi:hypothetical protein